MDNLTPSIDFSRPIDPTVFKDRVALITGGASGIGEGVARALASHGALVAIVDFNASLGEALAKELTTQGQKAKFFKCDVTDWSQQAQVFKDTVAWGNGRLSIVIPSAGLGATSLKAELEKVHHIDEPVEPNLRVLDVNLKGVYFTTSLALHYFWHLAASPAPQLCLIASLAGYTGLPMAADYCASKFGVRGLWKTLRANGGSREMGGCQVNVIAPTYIRTPMTGDLCDRLEAGGIKVGVVGDVVAAVLRAVGDERVEGRAICACAGGEGGEGSRNFDLEDDLEHGDGALKLRAATEKDGPLGAITGVSRNQM
ncbi:hypothetical protein B0A48_05206 [Cryoendolithus antarcticus]|uniref:NAD(P)-binding protein n=1 Tax=Cryoendolithus antarcticus TaxID=1507870 RepID=A0A1V8TI82_9PEZI|nr:hypothetical protein B0A48_05206 [Cryoendolithus antarcticus]